MYFYEGYSGVRNINSVKVHGKVNNALLLFYDSKLSV